MTRRFPPVRRFVGALALLSASCGDPSPSTVPAVVVEEQDSAGVTLVRIAGDVSDLPLWKVGGTPELEIRGDQEPYLGQIGEVALLSDGGLLVADAQDASLHRFALEGAHHVVGREGDGPGEFRTVSALSLGPADTAYVFDRRHGRVSVFGPDSELRRTVPLGAGIAALGAPRVVWSLGAPGFVARLTGPFVGQAEPEGAIRDHREAILLSLDAGGEARGPEVRFEGGYTIRAVIDGQGIIIVAPFANTPIAAVDRQRVVYGAGLAYELTIAGPDLAPARIVRWPGWAKPLSGEVIATARAEAKATFDEALPGQAESIVETMFSPDLLPTTLPALGAARLDDEGRIWVRRFQPNTSPWHESDAWHVLDPLGLPLARLELPEGARLAGVRGARVAVVQRDELGVEHLRVHALEKSTVR